MKMLLVAPDALYEDRTIVKTFPNCPILSRSQTTTSSAAFFDSKWILTVPYNLVTVLTETASWIYAFLWSVVVTGTASGSSTFF